MFRIETYNQEHKGRWNDFVKSSKNGTFLFERDYMEYHSDRFVDHSLLVFDKKDSLVALLPANIDGHILHTHQGLTFGGFVINNKMRASTMLDVFNYVKGYLAQKAIKELVYKTIPHIYHRYPAEEDLYALFINNADLYRVDISSVIDIKNHIGFDRSRKRGIASAKDHRLKVCQSEDFAGFMAIVEQRLDNKYCTKPTHTKEEIELLASRFPNNIKLYAVYDGDKMLCGGIMYEMPHIINAQYIFASSEGLEKNAIDLLLHHIINHVAKECRFFNYGISNEQNGRYLNQDLISKKEGFGARAVVHQFYRVHTS